MLVIWGSPHAHRAYTPSSCQLLCLHSSYAQLLTKHTVQIYSSAHCAHGGCLKLMRTKNMTFQRSLERTKRITERET